MLLEARCTDSFPVFLNGSHGGPANIRMVGHCCDCTQRFEGHQQENSFTCTLILELLARLLDNRQSDVPQIFVALYVLVVMIVWFQNVLTTNMCSEPRLQTQVSVVWTLCFNRFIDSCLHEAHKFLVCATNQEFQHWPERSFLQFWLFTMMFTRKSSDTQNFVKFCW